MTITVVKYSIAVGRPPYARKKLGHAVSWAAWWRSPLGARPDLCGGSRTREEVPALVRHQARFLDGEVQLEAVEPRWCREWRPRWRDELNEQVDGPSRRAFEAEFAQHSFNAFGSGPGVQVVVLPEADAALRALGLDASATEADVRRAFRLRARDLHPDHGGSELAFKKLNGHYQRALTLVG